MDPLTCSMCPARHIALPRTTTCSPSDPGDRRLLIAQIAEPVWYEFVKRGLLT